MRTIRGAPIGLSSQGDLLAELEIAAVGVDPAGAIRSWNSAAARLYGRTAGEMLGASVASICVSPEDAMMAASIVDELVSVGRWRGELAIEDARGLPLRLDVRATVLMDGDKPAGFEAVVLDVSGRVRAEHRGAERESRRRLLRRVAGLGSWEWDPGDDRLVTSDEFISMLGLEPRLELTMAQAQALMPLADRRRVQLALEGVRSGAADSFSIKHRIRGSDGTVRWLEAHCAAVRDQCGVLARVHGVTQDVTARVLAGQRLREAGKFWLATLDSLTAHVAVLDEHGDIVAVNASWRRFAEREGGGSDYVGSNYIAVCEAASDPQAKAVAEGFSELLAGERDRFELEYPCHSPTTQRWFLLCATRHPGPGPPPAIVVLHADITERHQAREQAFMQAALLDEIDVAVIVTDPDLRVLSWNAGAERLYGWKAEEAIGRPRDELVAPEDVSLTGPNLAALRRDGRWDGEYVVRRKDGSTFPPHVRNRVMLDRDGDAKAFVGVSMDISERKESERALRSARNYLRAVTDSMGEGVYVADSEGRLTYANQVAQDLLGWSLEEARGRVMHDLVHHRRADGSPLPIEQWELPVIEHRAVQIAADGRGVGGAAEGADRDQGS